MIIRFAACGGRPQAPSLATLPRVAQNNRGPGGVCFIENAEQENAGEIRMRAAARRFRLAVGVCADWFDRVPSTGGRLLPRQADQARGGPSDPGGGYDAY